MKKKVVITFGTRPEIIRLTPTILKLRKFFNCILINTNQNFDPNLNKKFIKELGITKPKYSLKNNYKNNILFISNMLVQVDKILTKEKPDAFLVLGDTNSALSLYLAKRAKIPSFHIEAGNRCFDNRVPEELNRKIIDNIADINIVYSDVAKQNLILENFPNDKIFKVGSPMKEIYNKFENKINKSNILNKLNLTKNSYFLVSLHREEIVNDEKKLKIIFKSLNIIMNKYNKIIVLSTHPRTLDKIKKYKVKMKKIVFHNPFGFFDYTLLQKNAAIILSDSGSITEESNILNLKSVNLRFTNERQEGFEASGVIMPGIDHDMIIQTIDYLINNEITNQIHPDYSDSNFSDKVLYLISSYMNYVKEKSWFNFD
jgi:UDP-N-acetylglucosamine 2-epimerase